MPGPCGGCLTIHVHVGQADLSRQQQKKWRHHSLFFVLTRCSVTDCHQMRLSVPAVTHGVQNVEAALFCVDDRTWVAESRCV